LSEEIEDIACLKFTENFYWHLLEKNSTVCKAYNQAINTLRIENPGEAKKFRIYGPKANNEEGTHEED
jgi:hypothetical protein